MFKPHITLSNYSSSLYVKKKDSKSLQTNENVLKTVCQNSDVTALNFQVPLFPLHPPSPRKFGDIQMCLIVHRSTFPLYLPLDYAYTRTMAVSMTPGRPGATEQYAAAIAQSV